MMKIKLMLVGLLLITLFISCDLFLPQEEIIDVPTNVRASTDLIEKITVSWDYKDYIGLDGFKIYRSRSQDGNYSIIATVDNYYKQYVDEVDMMETFYYYVTAYDGSIESKASSIVIGKTSYSYPKNIIFSADLTSVRLSWTAIPGVESYRVYTSNYSWGTYNLLAETSDDFYKNEEATDKILYYKISSVVNGKESALSDGIGASTDSLPAPANFSVTDDWLGVQLNWNAVENSSAYKIYKSISSSIYSDMEFLVELNETSYFDSSAIDSSRYYAVAAVKEDGEDGSRSDKKAGQLRDLDSPSGLAGRLVASGEYELSWNGIEGVDSYEVYRSTSSSTNIPAPQLIGTTSDTKLIHDVSDLPAGNYYYRVKVFVHDIESDYSSYLWTFVPGKPEIDTVSETQGGLNISWSLSSAPVGSQVCILRSQNPEGEFILIDKVNADDNQYNDNNVNFGNYYYKIILETSGIETPESDYIGIELTGRVTGVTASDGSELNAITVSWDNNSWADYYRVYFCTTINGTYSLLEDNITSSVYQHTGLAKGDSYYYKVSAVSGLDELVLSEADKGESFGRAPNAPTLSSDFDYPDIIIIHFTSSPGARRYQIGVYDDGELAGLISDNTNNSYYTASNSPIYFDPTGLNGFVSFRVLSVYTSIGEPNSDEVSFVGAESESKLIL